MKVIVPDNLIEDAEREWASPAIPVFKLVPDGCGEHFASIYMQLGSPEVCHDTFWDVYNKVREAVDPEILFQSCDSRFEEVHASSDPDVEPAEPQLPLHHLRACEFGVDRIPAGRTCEGETGPFIYFLSS